MKYKYLILAIFFALFSCGGGTKGTGTLTGSSSGELGRFTGVILNPSSVGLPNLNVTILETGDSDTTNSQGEFDVNTSFDDVNDRMTVVIESESESVYVEVYIYDIPQDVQLIEVNLVATKSEFTGFTSISVTGISFDGISQSA